MKKKDKYQTWEKEGWNNMSELLDQKMPRKKKRRALVFWLLSLGIISLSAVFIPLVLSSHQEEKTEKTTKEIAHTPSIPLSPVVPSRTQQENTHSSSSQPITKLESTTRKTVLKTTNKISPKTSLIHLINNELNSNKTTKYTKKTHKKNVIPKERKTEKTTEKKIHHLVEKVSPLSSPTLATPLGLSIPNRLHQPLKKSAWEYDLLAGATLQQHQHAGFKIGTSVSYNFNRKWALALGLAHQCTWQSLQNLVPQSIIAQYNQDLDNQELHKYSFVAYLQIPLLVRYKITPKWHLESGLMYSAYIPNMANSDVLISDNSNTTPTNPTTNPPPQFLSLDDIIPNSNTYATLGLQYQFSNRWKIAVQYQYDWKKYYIPNSSITLKRYQQWGVTLKWKINN